MNDNLNEYEKCKNDPHYFYTKYVNNNGKKVFTHLTKEQFNELFDKVKNGIFISHRRSR